MNHENPMSEMIKVLQVEGDVELPMDPAYWDGLHAKIMDGLDKKPKSPAPWYEKPRSVLNTNWKSWVVSGGSVSALLLATHLSSSPSSFSAVEAPIETSVATQEDHFLSEALRSPDLINQSILVSQSRGPKSTRKN